MNNLIKTLLNLLKPYRNLIKTLLNAYLNPHSIAELKGPRTLLRIRPGIFDVEPELGLKLGQHKPNISGTLPQTGTLRFRTILARFRRVSVR